MGLASHLGPWLLGTVKNTQWYNCWHDSQYGRYHCCQTGATTVADTSAATLFVLPAGDS